MILNALYGGKRIWVRDATPTRHVEHNLAWFSEARLKEEAGGGEALTVRYLTAPTLVTSNTFKEMESEVEGYNLVGVSVIAEEGLRAWIRRDLIAGLLESTDGKSVEILTNDGHMSVCNSFDELLAQIEGQ